MESTKLGLSQVLGALSFFGTLGKYTMAIYLSLGM